MPATFGDVDDVPGGTIMLWDDSLSNIPSGWVLCDGNNSTPDLTDKFVKGVPDSNTDPGATGGQSSLTISSAQMAQHAHAATEQTSGGHSHSFDFHDNQPIDYDDDLDRLTTPLGTTVSTDTVGDHTHIINDNSVGGGSSIENRPSYVELAYIMKS